MNNLNLDVLYKYKSIEPDGFTLAILEKGEIYLPNSYQLNDPYDCGMLPKVTFQGVPLYELEGSNLVRYFEWHSKEYDVCFKDHTDKMHQLNRFIEQNKSLKSRCDLEFINKDYVSQVRKIQRSNIGIFSLTHNPVNNVMWSHYSKNHTGICIGFDPSILSMTLRSELCKVEYRPMPPTWELTDSEDDKTTKLLGTKFTSWQYEEEYRIINLLESKKTFLINASGIKEVILGIDISKTNEDKILEIVKAKLNHCKVFKCKLQDYKFEIGLERIY